MRNKQFKLTVILLLLFTTVNAQDAGSIKKYVVFTFEISHKHSKLKEHYYWMTPQDSILLKNAFGVYPLYTESYSKDVLDRCMAGNAVDVFSTSTVTDFNFCDNYQQEVKHLLLLLSKNKVKVHSFKKRWSANKDEVKIQVYASPVMGNFCNCAQSHGNITSGFKGLIYLPANSFSYDENFWSGKSAEIVKYVDYSYVQYRSHYPSYIHGNANIRVESKIQTSNN